MRRGHVALATALMVFAAWAAKLALQAVGYGRDAQVRLYDEYIFTFCHRGPDHAKYAGFEASRLGWCPAWLRGFDWFLDPESTSSLADPGNVPTWQIRIGAWLHRPPVHRRGLDPTTVFAGPYAAEELLAIAHRQFDSSHANRTVVFGGVDAPLSAAFGRTPAARASLVAKLNKFFSRIYYTAKDVELDGVESAVMGLDDRHYTHPGVAEAALAAIAGARTDAASKPRGVLVAFRDTMWHCHLHTAAREEWRQSCEAAAVSRSSALAWARTQQAKDAGVVTRTASDSLPQQEFWAQLATFRFLISPRGIGLQSPKTIEALLVFTIPIVQRATVFEDLSRQGFPLVIVDAWSEITAAKLEKWWHELSPTLAAFRQKCLTADGYHRLISGEVASCE